MKTFFWQLSIPQFNSGRTVQDSVAFFHKQQPAVILKTHRPMLTRSGNRKQRNVQSKQCS